VLYLLGVQLIDVDVITRGVVEDHFAVGDDGRWFQEALDPIGQGGLPAAALARQAEDLAALEFEIDVDHRSHGRFDVVDHREIVHCQECVARHRVIAFVLVLCGGGYPTPAQHVCQLLDLQFL
jgi:hypothetical protein